MTYSNNPGSMKLTYTAVLWNLAAKSDSSTVTADELWELYMRVSLAMRDRLCFLGN